MSINRKKIIRNYTIIEVMVAMGIFLIMMTIMMQFFTSAQKVWNASAKRNMIYADARVAMNLMTREIQSILYDNDGNDLPNSIYPFWYEWYDINSYLTSGNTRPQEIKDHYLSNNELFEHSASSPYLTALNFISTTDLKPVDRGSDVCEIRYRFVPIYYKNSSPQTSSDIGGGRFERSCVAEYYTGGGTTSTGTTGHYNFSDWQYKGPNPASPDDERVIKIWPATAPDPEGPFKKVIDGVYSLRFTCYRWDTTNSVMTNIAAIDSTGAQLSVKYPITFNLSMGTPVPVAVRIDMKLMDPKDLKQLALNIYRAGTGDKEAEKQIKTLKQKIRTFSKVIYLGKRED